MLMDQYGTQEQEFRVVKWTPLFETQGMGVDKLIMLLSLHLKFSSRDAHNVDGNVDQRPQRHNGGGGGCHDAIRLEQPDAEEPVRRRCEMGWAPSHRELCVVARSFLEMLSIDND